ERRAVHRRHVSRPRGGSRRRRGMSATPRRGPLGRVHPALILAALDLAGLLIALYLSSVELQGELPYCGPLHGCEEVALSVYSRVCGIPVAVFGVCLSSILLTLALAWLRTAELRVPPPPA